MVVDDIRTGVFLPPDPPKRMIGFMHLRMTEFGVGELSKAYGENQEAGVSAIRKKAKRLIQKCVHTRMARREESFQGEEKFMSVREGGLGCARGHPMVLEFSDESLEAGELIATSLEDADWTRRPYFASTSTPPPARSTTPPSSSSVGNAPVVAAPAPDADADAAFAALLREANASLLQQRKAGREEEDHRNGRPASPPKSGGAGSSVTTPEKIQEVYRTRGHSKKKRRNRGGGGGGRRKD